LKERKQYEIRVQGRVQGVGFRHAAQQKARESGLRGWVENCPDGSVMIMIGGSQETCNRYIRWCHEGPAYSWVEKVDVREVGITDLDAFRIRR
jgi:acylphosphatase